MELDILNLMPHQVEITCELLHAMGYRYGEDFEALYGPGWTLSGLRITHPLLVLFLMLELGLA